MTNPLAEIVERILEPMDNPKKRRGDWKSTLFFVILGLVVFGSCVGGLIAYLR